MIKKNSLIPLFVLSIMWIIPTYAEPLIPQWALQLHEFWKEEKINDKTLLNAVSYLNEKNIIILTMPQTYDLKSNFLLSIMQYEFSSHKQNNCEENWYITGYYVPVEANFQSKLIEIKIDYKTFLFDSDFVNSVKTEGWGRTNHGNYLGWHSEKFHLNETPLDYFGNNLAVGIVAVDPSIIEFGNTITAPSLPSPWNQINLTASDIGPSIKGKHIDVYTGEGKMAKNETRNITGYGNKVCFLD